MKETVFGDNLTRLRKERKLTRRAFADAFQLPVTTVAGYETAGREPKFSLLIKFADFFNVSIDNLVRDSNFNKDDSKRQVLYNANLLKLPDEQEVAFYEFLKALQKLTGEGFTVKTKIVKA